MTTDDLTAPPFTPDDLDLLRRVWLNYPFIKRLCDALEAAWSERDELQRWEARCTVLEPLLVDVTGWCSDGACHWCDSSDEHDESCPYRVAMSGTVEAPRGPEAARFRGMLKYASGVLLDEEGDNAALIALRHELDVVIDGGQLPGRDGNA